MPLRPELRHLYRTPEWTSAKSRIAIRAQGRCEKCGAKKGQKYFSARTGKLVVVQLHLAHSDHEDLDRFYDDDNLNYLCASCHLKFDSELHIRRARETRSAAKDRKRPLLARAA